MKNQITRIALTVFLLIAGTRCTTVIPVHEGEPPEVLSGGKFRLSQFAGSSPVLATKTNVDLNEAVLYPISGYRLGAGLSDKFQLNIDVMGAGISAGFSFSGRYQWVGADYFNAKKGNKSQTTTLRSFSSIGLDTDINEDGNLYPYADLKASGLDLAHIFGYRFKDWFGVYAGPKYLSGKVESNFKNVENGPIVATDSRNFTGYGALAGMFFSFTGKHIGFDINLEYDGMSLPASYGTDHVWYNGWHLLLGVPFGF